MDFLYRNQNIDSKHFIRVSYWTPYLIFIKQTMRRTITIANGHLIQAMHDKEYLAVVAAVLCIKLRFVDSTIKHCTVRNLMKIIGCSNKKAQEILHLFTEYDICEKNERNIIVPQIKRYDGKRKKYGGIQKIYIQNGKISINKNDKTVEYEINYKNVVEVLEMLALYNHLYQKERIADLMQNGKNDSKKSRIKKTALKRKMSQKGVELDRMSCLRGTSEKTLAKAMNFSTSKVKYRLKKMKEAGAIISSNKTDFHKPTRIVDYNEVETLRKKLEAKKESIGHAKAKKPMSATDIFKIAYADGDFSLKYHSAVMHDLLMQEMCSKTIKSKTFGKIGDDGMEHTTRNYYVCYPNEYKCLL